MVSENSDQSSSESHGLSLAESYRRFSRAMESFSDFDQFRGSLAKALEADPHLSNALLTAEDHLTGDARTKAEQTFEMGSVVLPLKGGAEGNFIRVAGRRDSRPFGAEDLHLMGSIAGFVSSLYAQSKNQQQSRRKMEVLQFLIDQLPMGVVCFDQDGSLLAGNTTAWRQLGLSKVPSRSEDAPILEHLKDVGGSRDEVHFEVDERLIFALKRGFELSEGNGISAFVLYDMSKRRERLVDTLDREYFKARCVEGRVAVAMLHDASQPGGVYARAKQYADDWQIDRDYVQPLDAYSTACLFPGSSIAEVRESIRSFSEHLSRGNLRVTILEAFGEVDSSPAQMTLAEAAQRLAPQEDVLLPRVLVFDSYAPVVETLELMLDGICKIDPVEDIEGAFNVLDQFGHDGLIVELDAISSDEVKLLKEKALDRGIPILFSSVRQHGMVDREAWGLDSDDLLLHKPFNADQVIGAIGLKLNLA